ncbi:uncharacterized protein STEHIDRAFT_63775 [Stereum hirsutum FP-91666 SS1]|uniref:uncharacterized protein n=1 Tax=Stereum hirsutum (strain FP-91666) TaxID=721885 RepID=UPI0004449EF1|nr:uncharacterized protein STEHIDRAFT_63775 [Stereum hirsutum FP-91666 SS1]EIM82611.1 hypothetical protein STEHIDRAFT_63775 [Stereum hirsutum FP-91666 SS1]
MAPLKFSISVLFIISYLVLVRCLRWRRYDKLHMKYMKRDINSLTMREAQEILQLSLLWDMPDLVIYAYSFALFKTYGIPTISELLTNTNELSCESSVSKRYSDASVFLLYFATWLNCCITAMVGQPGDSRTETTIGADDPRGAIALARVNWLHSKYKISNDDYLYTLALFILEPITWCSKWGWRPLSDLEAHAMFVYWRNIGENMHIKDIPETLDELREWSLSYETTAMIPRQSNHDLAEATTNELLGTVPNGLGLRTILRHVVWALLDERVRIAMMFPPQHQILHGTISICRMAFILFERYCCLPRFGPRLFVNAPHNMNMTPDDGSSLPRMHPAWFAARPWYRRESNGLRWMVERVALALGMITVYKIPSKELKSQGYRLEEMVGQHPLCMIEIHYADTLYILGPCSI